MYFSNKILICTMPASDMTTQCMLMTIKYCVRRNYYAHIMKTKNKKILFLLKPIRALKSCLNNVFPRKQTTILLLYGLF